MILDNDFVKSLGYDQLIKYIFTILQYECRDNGKELILFTNSPLNLYFDAFAPTGIYKNDSSPTFIITKISTANREFMPSYYLRDIDGIYHYIKSEEFKKKYFPDTEEEIKILFISNVSKEKQEMLSRDRPNAKLEFWSIDQTVEKGIKYPLEFNALVQLAISNSRSSKKIAEFSKYSREINLDDKKKQNSILCDELAELIRENTASLILGTGVSMSYNEKLSWDALADRLYSKLPDFKKFNDLDTSLEVLGKDNFSKAQYSRENLSESEYAHTVYKLLYPKKNAYTIGNTTLDECANLVSTTFNHGRHPFNKVITYNYDNFFEKALDARFCKYKVLYQENDYVSRSCIPIFHVHGFMPEGCSFSELTGLINKMVFTEEDYFKNYSDSSNWMVATQLEAFKDSVCLFVGNSISDFNEKRLLNRTKHKPISNYAIMDSRGLKGSDLSKLHSHFIYGLNVKIIWAENVDEIPNLIKRITHKIIKNSNNSF